MRFNIYFDYRHSSGKFVIRLHLAVLTANNWTKTNVNDVNHVMVVLTVNSSRPSTSSAIRVPATTVTIHHHYCGPQKIELAAFRKRILLRPAPGRTGARTLPNVAS